MLVLTRCIGEEIVIAGDIRVVVLGVKGTKVRLGIAAPTSVPVARLEVFVDGSQSTLSSPSAKIRQS